MQQVWTRPELFLQNAPLAIIFFPTCNTSNTEIQICALFLRRPGFGAWKYPDYFSSRAPGKCGHSWISPYPVLENETTAGPEPAEGISADRHKAEPFVQNAQGHLGAVELLQIMLFAECQLHGGWDNLLLLADSAF